MRLQYETACIDMRYIMQLLYGKLEIHNYILSAAENLVFEGCYSCSYQGCIFELHKTN